MFETLALAVKEVGQLDLDTAGDDELTEAVLDLARIRAALEAAEARLAAGWDRLRLWAADGARSGAAWLARRTRQPKADCARRIRLGRAIDDLPVAGEAWLAGDLDRAHVQRLARARNHRTAKALRDDEAMLVHEAGNLRFDDWDQFIEYWSLHADPDGASKRDIDRADRRRVSLAETLGGMWSGSILLDPTRGTTVANELERLEQLLFDADRAEAKARLGHDPLPTELRRTSEQRRADALVEMATRSRTAPADGKAPRPLFTVVLGNDAFNHLIQLASGTVVSPTALLPWLSSADVERVLFAGPDRAGHLGEPQALLHRRPAAPHRGP